jgi:uncharacterized protein with NRDE domain
MCLILFAYQSHPRYKLIFAANRDEYYNRPTAPAGWWEEAPFLLAGKDLKAGGTWLGITKKGKIAALTNYREPEHRHPDAPSRGPLVSDYLLSDMSVAAYLEALRAKENKYNGFNLILGDTDHLYYYSNRENQNRRNPLEPGLYGLSNGHLNSPWPKVVKGKQMLEQQVLNAPEISLEILFSILGDTAAVPDEQLPDTGVGIAIERVLSPLFIKVPGHGYGTRSSTVLLVDHDNRVTFEERSFVPPGENKWQFML